METRSSSINMCEQNGSGRVIGSGRSLLAAAIRAEPGVEPDRRWSCSAVLPTPRLRASAGLINTTGRTYRQSYVLFLRAASGKIAFLREYFDPTRAAQAM